MSVEIQVQYDSRELPIWLNRTIAQVKTEASRNIRQEVRLKAKDVNRGLVIVRANSQKGALVTMQASIQVNTNPVPLFQYGAKQTKQGVTVNVKGIRKLVKHAFIAKMKSGHEGVFLQRGKARLPIDELYSTRLSDVFYNSGFILKPQQFALIKFTINLQQDISFFSGKKLKS